MPWYRHALDSTWRAGDRPGHRVEWSPGLGEPRGLEKGWDFGSRAEGQRTLPSLKARNRLRLQMRNWSHQERLSKFHGPRWEPLAGCSHLVLTWNSGIHTGSLKSAMVGIVTPWRGSRWKTKTFPRRRKASGRMNKIQKWSSHVRVWTIPILARDSHGAASFCVLLLTMSSHYLSSVIFLSLLGGTQGIIVSMLEVGKS